MVLETAQILSTAYFHKLEKGETLEIKTDYLLLLKEKKIYSPTHQKHPCVLWTKLTKGNWEWLLAHGKEMGEEYKRRYGRDHKSNRIIQELSNKNLKWDSQELTPFAKAMPVEYKTEDSVQSYNNYYLGAKKRIFSRSDFSRYSTLSDTPFFVLQLFKK